MFRDLPLDLINPFDMGHMSDGNGGFVCPTKEDTIAHHGGIEYVRGLIRQGKKIRPILVTPVRGNAKYQYQRCDGFKRYFAFKAENATHAPCMIVEDYLPGAQEGFSMEVE